MKKCMGCGEYNVKNLDHDYCYNCWSDLKEEEEDYSLEDSFEEDLDGKVYTTYLMFYGNKEKIGYTADLNSRIMELKRKFPNNKFVYFREFIKESDARTFEAWLKKLSPRELINFVARFQDKVRKIEFL